MYVEEKMESLDQRRGVMRVAQTIKGRYEALTTKVAPVYVKVEGDDYSSSCGNSDTAHEDVSECNPSTTYRSSEAFSRALSVLNAVVLAIITCSLAFRMLSHPTQHHARPTLTCGNTSADALAKGCVFDPLSYAWVPGLCFDTETADEFRTWLARPDLQRGSYPFFEDKYGKIRVQGEEALSQRIGGPNGVKTYAPQQEHEAHCVFAIRRYLRVSQHPEKRLVRDGIPHLMHCLEQLEQGLTTKRHQHKSLGSSFGVGFATC